MNKRKKLIMIIPAALAVSAAVFFAGGLFFDSGIGHEHHETRPAHDDREHEPGTGALERVARKRARLAYVETSEAVIRDLTVNLRLLGTVSYDETRMTDVAAWFPGRVEKLYVDFVGGYVGKGEPLLELYSPELGLAQDEYLSALRRAGERDEPGDIRVRSLESSRRRLELFGMIPAQVEKLEERGYAEDTLVFYAPSSGIVVERNAFEGGYFNTGEVLFHIADLSAVWLLADVYDRDFAFVHPGQEAEFITKAYPGESFHGEVVFIDPVVNPATRTVRLRLEVDNPGGRLKPGMDGTAVLAYDAGEQLSIPRSAPLLTGRRTVVYVEKSPLVYNLREVVLGPLSGDYYPVVSGLEEGERVVTRGNFKLDPAIQVLDRPSIIPDILEDPEGLIRELEEEEIDDAIEEEPHIH